MKRLISKVINNVWLDSLACMVFFVLVFTIVRLFADINFLGICILAILCGCVWNQMFYREGDNDYKD